ncbi:MAG: alpha-ketoglutarate-dependent dioxygenase AlkB, partial [Mesorhizobium sp.]
MPPLKTSAAARQGDLFAATDDLPEGFHYQPELITPDEEAALASQLATLPFQAFD